MMLVEVQIGITTMENSDGSLKIKSRITTSFNNKRVKSRIFKRYLHIYVYSNIIPDSQGMAATQMSNHRRMDKQNVVYTYDGILLNLKRKIVLV